MRPPGGWRAGGRRGVQNSAKIFLRGFVRGVRASARAGKIFFSKLSVVRFGGRRRTEEDAVFVCLTGGKAQFRLHSAS